MEKKLLVLQSILCVMLGIAIAALAYALWLYWNERGNQSPFGNAHFVNAIHWEARG